MAGAGVGSVEVVSYNEIAKFPPVIKKYKKNTHTISIDMIKQQPRVPLSLFGLLEVLLFRRKDGGLSSPAMVVKKTRRKCN